MFPRYFSFILLVLLHIRSHGTCEFGVIYLLENLFLVTFEHTRQSENY